MARNRRLDDLGENLADQPDNEQRDSDKHKYQRGGTFVVVAGTRARRNRRNAKQHLPQHGNHNQPENPADEANVQAHIAVENMRKFMPDDGLQFVARKFVQRPARNGDRRTVRARSRRKGVDAFFVFENKNFRNGDTGRERHFLHDVDEAALVERDGSGRNFAAAELARDVRARGSRKINRFEQTRSADDNQRSRRNDNDQKRIPKHVFRAFPKRKKLFRKTAVGGEIHRRADDEVNRRRRSRKGERKPEHEPVRGAPGIVLAFKKIGGTHCSHNRNSNAKTQIEI